MFASDALSSVAYAPQEIFLVLSVAGLAAYSFAPWIGLAVAAVMLVVVASYRQNVHAYPSGGGDYEVVTTNLGPTSGLTVASALLVDYILTVAVSMAAAVANIGSAVPFIDEHKVCSPSSRSCCLPRRTCAASASRAPRSPSRSTRSSSGCSSC